MQKETALSVHFNSMDVATTGFQLLSVIYPLATFFDGCQLGWTSTLSFIASLSRFMLWQKLINPNSKDDTWSHITKRDNPNVMGTIPWSWWNFPWGWPALLSSVVFHFNQVIALRVCVCMLWVFCLSMSVHLCKNYGHLCVNLHMRQLEWCMSVCRLWAAALCPQRWGSAWHHRGSIAAPAWGCVHFEVNGSLLGICLLSVMPMVKKGKCVWKPGGATLSWVREERTVQTLQVRAVNQHCCAVHTVKWGNHVTLRWCVFSCLCVCLRVCLRER